MESSSPVLLRWPPGPIKKIFWLYLREITCFYKKRIKCFSTRLELGTPAKPWKRKYKPWTEHRTLQRATKRKLKRVLRLCMTCSHAQLITLDLEFSKFNRSFSDSSTPHFCEKKSILCNTSGGEIENFWSIVILFLIVQRAQTTIAKWKSLRWESWHCKGNQKAKKSVMFRGTLSHPKASLRHPTRI